MTLDVSLPIKGDILNIMQFKVNLKCDYFKKGVEICSVVKKGSK